MNKRDKIGFIKNLCGSVAAAQNLETSLPSRGSDKPALAADIDTVRDWLRKTSDDGSRTDGERLAAQALLRMIETESECNGFGLTDNKLAVNAGLLADKIESLTDDGSECYPWDQDELDLMVTALRALETKATD